MLNMRFRVANQLGQPVGSQARYQFSQLALPLDDDVILRGLTGALNLLRTDRGLLASLKAHCTVRQTCSRCLEEFDQPLSLHLQEEYLPTVDVVSGLPLRLPPGTDNFLIDAQQVLDLKEALRQYKLMAEPLKPLCRPDCAGLCPRCGHNLNLGPCPCPPTEADPRWQALRLSSGQALAQLSADWKQEGS